MYCPVTIYTIIKSMLVFQCWLKSSIRFKTKCNSCIYHMNCIGIWCLCPTHTLLYSDINSILKWALKRFLFDLWYFNVVHMTVRINQIYLPDLYQIYLLKFWVFMFQQLWCVCLIENCFQVNCPMASRPINSFNNAVWFYRFKVEN